MAAAAAIPLAQAGIKAVTGIVQKIFGGMALRAKQAANENSGLQQVVQGFDQAIQQVSQQLNQGAISLSDAQAEIASIWSWYWSSLTPIIQPNRNGCSSGGACPGNARDYASSNGAPPGYCKGNIGASCCVGCGPIRLSLDSISDVLSAGGGTAQIAGIVGDHYGLQTRPAYTLDFRPPKGGQSVVGTIQGTVSSLFGVNGPNSVLQHAPSNGMVPAYYQGDGSIVPYSSPTTTKYLLFGGIGIFFLLLLVILRK